MHICLPLVQSLIVFGITIVRCFAYINDFVFHSQVFLSLGNVTPVDVYSHIPAMCEEKEIPYIYVPSREHLGLAAGI